MTLDLRTQLLSGLVIYATLAFLVFDVYRRNRTTVPCTLCWFMGFLSLVAGAVALILRGIVPAYLSIMVANPALFACYSLFLIAAAEMTGHRLSRKVMVAIAAVFFCVFAFFTFVVPSLVVRSLMITSSIVVLSAGSAYCLWRPKSPGVSLVSGTTALVFTLLSLLHLIRLVLIVTVDARIDFLTAPIWDVLFFMLGTALLVALALAYITMINGQISKQLQKSLGENKTLFRELRHRTKNNLSMISGLVNLQSDSVKGADAKEAFRNLGHRLSTIIAVYDLLSREGDRPDGSADPAEYLGEIVGGLEDTIPPGRAVSLDLDAAPGGRLPVAALVPLGLILNELVMNALKYAFPDGASGRVAVSYRSESHRATLTVEDDGVGFPKHPTAPEGSGLGLPLVYSLMEQLNGTVVREAPPAGGTRFVMEFPCP